GAHVCDADLARGLHRGAFAVAREHHDAHAQLAKPIDGVLRFGAYLVRQMEGAAEVAADGAEDDDVAELLALRLLLLRLLRGLDAALFEEREVADEDLLAI